MKEMLTDKKIERINAVDVMVVSIGGGNKVTYKSMIDLAKRRGVNYLVPTNYQDDDLKKFLDETDNEGKEAIESLKVDKDGLPDGLEVVVLKDGRNN
jgi:predicted ThiF/HesA family dinucleotide-utilizing enzyme